MKMYNRGKYMRHVTIHFQEGQTTDSTDRAFFVILSDAYNVNVNVTPTRSDLPTSTQLPVHCRLVFFFSSRLLLSVSSHAVITNITSPRKISRS